MQAVVPSEYGQYLQMLQGWEIKNDHHLYRRFEFPNFITALDFVNRIGDVAEKLGHHPNIHFTWGFVELDIFTHTLNGLSVLDFELAKQIQNLT